MGIVWLGFEVSVPQVVLAIVTAALIDVTLTYARTGRLVWPASGMLTGSGVALILRHVGTGAGEYWSWTGWYWFAGVAGVSVLTKYLVRWRDDHIFNPSNVGLVAAFLLVGGETIEPLDFWWAPLDFSMVLTYCVIIGGGVAITRRLRLLEMALVFWVILVSGLGVLAASGHCMIATWSPTPVCDADFWTTLATSPEILIFLFFMITDPKTIPTGRLARVAFAASLAVLATLLIAPNATEYGAKVGLLGSLVLWSPLRWAFDKAFAARPGEDTGLRELLARLTGRDSARAFARGVAVGSLAVLVAVAIVFAGDPARRPAEAAVSRNGAPFPIEVDVQSLPIVTIDDSVRRLDFTVDDSTVRAIAVMLAENLALEAEALRTVDASLLALATGGERLPEMQARIDDAVTTGQRATDRYEFGSLTLRLADESEGQTSAALAFDADGTIETVVVDTQGETIETSTRSFTSTFVMRQLAGDRWLVVTEITR